MRSTILYLLTGIFILFAFTQCKDSISSTDTDSTVSFKKNTPTKNLKKPTLVIPGNNSEQPTSTSLKWEEVEGAESYQIQLSGDRKFSPTIVDSVSSSTEFEIQGLPYNSTIYWQVRPIAGQQQGPWSVSWKFTTMQKPDNSEPISTDLKSPDDGASDRSTNVELQWTAVASASAYKVQIATDKNFSSMVANQEVKGTSFQASDLGNEATYYWRVEPIVAEEETEWSEVFSFVTQSESEEIQSVTLVSPSDNASDLSTSPTLEWEVLSGIDEYQVQLATSSSFTSPAIDENTSQQSLDVMGLDNNQDYYWRVQAKNDGDPHNWSSVRSFNTKSETSDGGDSGSDDDGPNSVEGDRQALMDLYQATGGSNWSNSSGWGNGNPSNAWHGIEVNANGRVVSVDLSGNNLSGSLPESLGNLTQVRYFNVKQNRLSGELPWTGIGNMRSLTHLLLNGRTVDPDPASGPHHPGKNTSGSWSGERTNDFTGSIGPEIGNLVNLKQIELMGVNSEHTGITGALPGEIGNLNNLESLSLDFNSLNSLPNSMGNLANLLHFGISFNEFQGAAIPSGLGNMANLKYFWANRAGFGGQLPDFSGLDNLEIFIIPFNDLEGPLPEYLFDGTTPRINMVNLSFNNFTGGFPEIKGPNNLKALQINSNQLSGRIPASSVQNISSIVNFAFGWNDFEGEIPDLSHMYQLRFVRANDNNFTGIPPMVDTSNDRLKDMHFQNNRMSGDIPARLAEVGNLPLFNQINISNNQFSNADLQSLINAFSSDGNLSKLNY